MEGGKGLDPRLHPMNIHLGAGAPVHNYLSLWLYSSYEGVGHSHLQSVELVLTHLSNGLYLSGLGLRGLNFLLGMSYKNCL